MPPQDTNPGSQVLSREEWEHLKLLEKMHQVVPRREGSDLRGLVFNPRDIRFATQNRNEEIFILLRRHFITNFRWIFNIVLMSLFPLLLVAVLSIFGFNLPATMGLRLTTLAALVWYSGLISYGLTRFMDWYYNVYIVTDERVLDLTFVPLQSREVAETNLASVENVQEVSIGFLPNLLHYGDVKVYTAADKNVITFEAVPDPTVVRDRVSDLAKILRQVENDN